MGNVYTKLVEVQSKLKAPKSQFNKFGNYAYRNCEDVLEALKPLLNEVKAIINKAFEKTEQILTEHMDKLKFIAEYLITHEIMDDDQFKTVMETEEPTTQILEEIAAEKAEKSKKRNLEAKKAQDEIKAQVMQDEVQKANQAENAINGIDPNASRYNVKRKLAEDAQANKDADTLKEDENNSKNSTEE